MCAETSIVIVAPLGNCWSARISMPLPNVLKSTLLPFTFHSRTSSKVFPSLLVMSVAFKITLYFTARFPAFRTLYVQFGSQRTSSASCPAAFCHVSEVSLLSSLSFASNNLILSSPAWILFTPVLAVSVNHAKVMPTSIATHSTMESTLIKRAFFVFVWVIFLSSYCFFGIRHVKDTPCVNAVKTQGVSI